MTAVPTYALLVDWDSDGGLIIGDFEHLLDIDGWDRDPGNPNPPTLVRSTTRAYHGDASLLVTWSSSGTQPVGPNPMSKFVVGTSYTMSAWVYVPAGSVAVKCAISGISSGTASAVTDAWTQISYTFTATSATHILQIIPSTAPAGGERVWVDWVRITGPGEEITAQSPGVISDVTIDYGRDQARSLQPVTPGTAKFDVDNVSRAYSPENASSPLYGLLGPGREMLIEATVADKVYVMFNASVDDFDLDPNAGSWKAKFSGLDGLARLKNMPASTAVYPGLRTGAAINVLLDAIGWEGARDLDPGGTTIRWWCAETDDAFNELQAIVAAEGPAAFVTIGIDGEFIFRDRHHRLIRDASVSVQATFRDTGPFGAMYHPLVDTGTRTVSGGLGTSDSNHTYTNTGSAADYSVGSGKLKHSLGSVNVTRWSTTGSATNVDVQGAFSTSVAATGAAQQAALTGRFIDASNNYHVRADLGTSGSVTVNLIRVLAGVSTTLTSATSPLTYSAGVELMARLQIFGSQLRGMVWPASGTRPTAWDVSTTDTSLAGPGALGFASTLATGNTNTLPVTMSWDSLNEQVFEHDPPFAINLGWRDLVNSVDIDITDREPTGSPEKIWDDDTSFTLASGQTRSIEVTATDPFWAVETPTLGTVTDVPVSDPDFVTTGAGTPVVTFNRTSGKAITMQVAASGGSVNVLSMRLRAHPVKSTTTQKVHREDAASISVTRGPRGMKPSTTLLNRLDAEAVADLILGQRARRLPVVTFRVTNGTSGQLEQQLSRELSDRVRVIDSETGLDADCFIERISHTISDEGNTLETAFMAEKIPTAPNANVLTFDVAGRGFDDGVFAEAGRDDPATIFLFDVAGRGFDDGRFAT